MQDTARHEKFMFLFDIDGTLIDSSGAGGDAMLQALTNLFGCEAARQVSLSGRTDRGIMTELLTVNGVEATEVNILRLAQHYFELLPGVLAEREGRVLPGVIELLVELVDDERCHVALLTGNLPQAARIKLEHFKLWGFFNYGVFGHAAPNRRDLRQPALEYVRQLAGEIPTQNIVIIGDTPLDVDLALAMEARCLAVSTGGYQPQQLEEAGAHYVVDDLSRTDELLNWMLSTA